MANDVDSELVAGAFSLLPHVPGYALLAAVAVWTFKLGQRIGEVKGDMEAGQKAIEKSQVAQKVTEERLGALEVKVAAIPTREEMRAMFAEVRDDIRELRTSPLPPRPRARAPKGG